MNAQATQPESAPLAQGTPAPHFSLNSTPDQKVTLADFHGRPLVLVFYPADWSPVCSDQMVLYQEIASEFAKYAAQVVGISVDGVWCHAAFAKSRRIHFPLLADFEPKGNVARAYGVYRTREGYCDRALFVIDSHGAVQWSYVSPLGINPGADGILRALQSMSQKTVNS